MTAPALLSSTSPIDPRVSSPLFAPEVSQIALSQDERLVMQYLATLLLDPNYQSELYLSGLYYDGLNHVESLGISVPPELEALRATLGWCAAGVDARSERLQVRGFRMPDRTEIDDDLQVIWQANNMDAEAPLVHDDAEIYGRSFVVVGVGDDEPLITVESPRNMMGSWDVRRRELSAAFQTYLDIDPASPTYSHQLATLYTRMATIQMSIGDRGWQVDERNDHGMGFVPVRMFTHHPTVRNRYGSSVMTPAWRNTQDRACRLLARQEISSEFFAAMKIFILGASEQDFKNSDGSLATAWETYIGRISTLKADANGNLPDIKEVRGESPDGFISSFDQQTRIMSGHTGLAPQYLGIFSDGNPASADAIRMSDFRLKTIADRLTLPFGNEWEATMRIAMHIKGGFDLKAAQRMETDWEYTGIPTPNADAVTVTTQMATGSVPPTSSTALAKMGWTPLEIARLAIDRKKTEGLAVIDQALAGLKPPPATPFPGEPVGEGGSGQQQPVDGQQPKALAGLDSKRSTDGSSAG